MKRDGFSILEVVIATLIFSIVAVGSYSAIAALKQPASATKEEITAAFLGKQILEGLRADVDAETWPGGALDPNGGPGGNGVYDDLADVTIDGKTYSMAYTVEDDTATSAKKVTMTITW